MKKAYTFFFLLALSLVFIPRTLGANGDNCAVNIADSMPTGTNWDDVYIIKGEDGTAWQRAILANPDVMTIGENIPAAIKGTARTQADVQVFLFAPVRDANGKLQKPTKANCYSAGKANSEGQFELSIHPTMVWGNIGSKLVVDAFYRMEKSWDQMKAQETNQNFFIGTHIPMREIIFTTIPQDENKDDEERKLCHSENKYVKINLATKLDPASFRDDLKANNFAAVQEKVVGVGRMSGNALHTFYGGLEGGNGEVPKEEIAKVSLKAVAMEGFKRALLANSNVAGNEPGVSPINPQNLRAAVDDTGQSSELNKEFAKMIRNALAGTEQERNGAIKGMVEFYKEYVDRKGPRSYDIFSMMLEESFYDELFPKDVSTEDTWAEDFIQMLEFWTGAAEQNDELIFDDKYFYKNYNEPNGRNLGPGNSQEVCEEYPQLIYLHGISPRILLHTEKPVTLEPDFDDIQITYSQQSFDSADSWTLASGPKSELSYEYEARSPIKSASVAEYCVTKDDIPELVEKLASELILFQDEAEVLARELVSQLKYKNGFTKLSLQDPADIAKRFSWKGNGEGLNMLQIFFRAENDACNALNITDNAVININAGREGFEAGII